MILSRVADVVRGNAWNSKSGCTGTNVDPHPLTFVDLYIIIIIIIIIICLARKISWRHK